MYISPNHPNPPKAANPPEERGQRLATLPRVNGAELRVTLEATNGHPWVGLRVWEPDETGQLWPARGKGLSVMVPREIDGVIRALTEAKRLLSEQKPAKPAPPSPVATTTPDDRPVYREKRRRPEPRPVDGAALRQQRHAEDFDEIRDTGQAGQYDGRNVKAQR